MTIGNGKDLKGVLEILLPDSVVALNVFNYLTDFQEAQEENSVASKMRQHVQGVFGDLLAQIVDDADLGDLYCYVWNNPHWELFSTETPTATFTSTGDMLPHGVSALIRQYTTRPTTIGRKYVPGFGEGQITAGAWNSTALTALAAAAVEWGETQEVSANNDIIPAIFSKKTLFSYGFSETAVIPVYAGYQRRRRPGVGM